MAPDPTASDSYGAFHRASTPAGQGGVFHVATPPAAPPHAPPTSIPGLPQGKFDSQATLHLATLQGGIAATELKVRMYGENPGHVWFQVQGFPGYGNSPTGGSPPNDDMPGISKTNDIDVSFYAGGTSMSDLSPARLNISGHVDTKRGVLVVDRFTKSPDHGGPSAVFRAVPPQEIPLSQILAGGEVQATGASVANGNDADFRAAQTAKDAAAQVAAQLNPAAPRVPGPNEVLEGVLTSSTPLNEAGRMLHLSDPAEISRRLPQGNERFDVYADPSGSVWTNKHR